MTIANVIAGAYIDPTTFGNVVVDELNNRGYKGLPTGVSAVTGVGTSYTTITTFGFTAPADRRYRVTGRVKVRQRVAKGLVSVAITNSADTLLADESYQTIGIDDYATITHVIEHEPSAGSFTFKLRVKTSTNTVDVEANGFLLVEDIGPV